MIICSTTFIHHSTTYILWVIVLAQFLEKFGLFHASKNDFSLVSKIYFVGYVNWYSVRIILFLKFRLYSIIKHIAL